MMCMMCMNACRPRHTRHCCHKQNRYSIQLCNQMRFPLCAFCLLPFYTDNTICMSTLSLFLSLSPHLCPSFLALTLHLVLSLVATCLHVYVCMYVCMCMHIFSCQCLGKIFVFTHIVCNIFRKQWYFWPLLFNALKNISFKILR